MKQDFFKRLFQSSSLALVLAVSPFVIVMLPMIQIPIEILGNSEFFIEDDLFYYIEIARNVSIGNGFTFDGVTNTSGFHLLWQLVLIPVVSVADNFGIYGSLFATLFINFFLIIIAIVLTWKILVVPLGKVLSGIVVGISYAIVSPLIFNGMETSLSIALVALATLQLTRIEANGIISRSSQILLVGSISLLIPSRMDLAPVTIGMVLILLILGKKKLFVYSLITSLLVFLSQLVFYYSLDGNPLPISSRVKSWWSAIGIGDSSRIGLWDNILNLFGSFTKPFGIDLSEQFVFVLTFISITSLIFLLLGSVGLMRNVNMFRNNFGEFLNRFKFSTLFALALIFWVTSLTQFVYYTFFSAGMWRWYFGFPAIVWLTTVFSIGIYYLSKLVRNTSFLIAGVAWALVICSIFGTQQSSAKWVIENGTWGKGILSLEDWLNDNIPQNASIGTWAAGQLGYLHDASVVNLEGLVSNSEMLDANQNSDLFSWIKAHHIEYVASWFPIESMENPTNCPKEIGFKFQDIRISPLEKNCSHLRLIGSINLPPPKNNLEKIYIWEVIS